MRASLSCFVFLGCFAGTAYADDPNSVSDYYRATGRDSSFQQRAADFNKLRPAEKYTGSADQNTLLHKTLRFGDQMAAQGEPSMGLFRTSQQSNGHRRKTAPRLPWSEGGMSQSRSGDPGWAQRSRHEEMPPAIELEEGVQPDWLDPLNMLLSGPLGRLGNSAKEATAVRSAPKRIDSGRLLHRSRIDPSPHHNFPGQIDDWVFEGTKQVKSPQYHLYTRPGTLTGKSGVPESGVYEIGVRPSPSGKTEAVMHRLFRPDKGKK